MAAVDGKFGKISGRFGSGLFFRLSLIHISTLLRLIAGLEQPQAGAVQGTEQLRFAWVFQQDRLLPWATVWQNVALAGDLQTAKRYLTNLGLEDQLQQYPSALSGGMARRAAIARALSYGGDVVLLDEAFNGLDLQNQQIAAQLLCERFPLRLLVTHRLEEASLFTDVHRIFLP